MIFYKEEHNDVVPGRKNGYIVHKRHEFVSQTNCRHMSSRNYSYVQLYMGLDHSSAIVFPVSRSLRKCAGKDDCMHVPVIVVMVPGHTLHLQNNNKAITDRHSIQGSSKSLRKMESSK